VTATLTLEDDTGSSVVVRISPVPVGVLYDVEARARRLPRTRAQFDALADAFLPFVESWTYPEPVDRDGLAARDINLALAIVHGWLRGVASAPLPLLRTSSDGEPSADDAP
jgi:hypothetical protein